MSPAQGRREIAICEAQRREDARADAEKREPRLIRTLEDITDLSPAALAGLAPEIEMKRSVAAKALDTIVAAMVSREEYGTVDDVVLTRIAVALRDAGIHLAAYTACDGEAHANPHIDNCTRCAPRWGVVGPEIKVT